MLLAAPGASAETNAAVIYDQAGAKLTVKPKDVSRKYQAVIESGVLPESDEIAKAAADNQAALALFARAANASRCDFTFGKEEKRTILSPIRQIAKEVTLAKLLILDGMLHERRGDVPGAIRRYATVLKAGRQFRSQRRIIFVLGGMLLQDLANKPLARLVGRGRLGRRECEALLTAFSRTAPSMADLEAAFRDEHVLQRTTTDLILDEFRQKPLEGTTVPFVEGMRGDFEKMLSDYFARLAHALRENDPELVDKESARLVQQARAENGGRDLSKATHWEVAWMAFRARLPGGDRKAAQAKFARRIVALAIPQYGKLITRAYASSAEFDVVRAGAAVRYYQARMRRGPADLREAVGFASLRMPRDPFNGMKPMRYLPGAEGAVVYSLGPDRKDQKGAPWDILGDKALEAPGDIALRLK